MRTILKLICAAAVVAAFCVAATAQKSRTIPDSLEDAIIAARYSAEMVDGEVFAPNYSNGFNTKFGRDGFELKSGATKAGWTIRFNLESIASSDSVIDAIGGEVIFDGQRVTIGRGPIIDEWFRNEPAGLKHGFTLHSRPFAGNDPVTLALRIDTDLRISEANGSVIFSDPTQKVRLTYDGLTVFDATGRTLRAKMTLEGKLLKIVVDDRDAIYPVTIDPTFQSESKLVASDGSANDLFGTSVAVSGNYAIVGAPGDSTGRVFNHGSAYLFSRSNSAWTAVKVVPTATGSATSGMSVAIKGTTAVVGAPGVQNRGRAYVYSFNGATWTLSATLSDSGGATGDQFGASVGVDGNSIIVGAPGDDVGANTNQGSAIFYKFINGSWTQSVKFSTSGTPNDAFGSDVDISGLVAVVGAPNKSNQNTTSIGAAYVYRSVLGTWIPEKTLNSTVGNFSTTDFGKSVAVAGSNIVVGAPNSGFTGLNTGSALVFSNGPSWPLQSVLIAPDGNLADGFGADVDIDGTNLVVGAPFDDVGSNPNQGSAHIFSFANNVWAHQHSVTAADGATDDQFAKSVAIAGDLVISGAAFDDEGSISNKGSAYVFKRIGSVWTEQAFNASTVQAENYYGWSVAIEGDFAVIGAPYEDVGANADQGAVYIYQRTGGVWSLLQKLTASDAVAGELYGNSVDISGGTIVVSGMLNPHFWIYEKSGATWTLKMRRETVATTWSNIRVQNVAISGTTIVAGCPSCTKAGVDSGSAFVVESSGIDWIQINQLSFPNGDSSSGLGFSVDISGETMAIGHGPWSANPKVQIYAKSGGNWSYSQTLTPSDGVGFDGFGSVCAIDGSRLVVGAPIADAGQNFDIGKAYAFQKNSNGTWTETQILMASDGGTSQTFGRAVAISGNMIVVGADGVSVPFSDAGAAYVFVNESGIWNETDKIQAANPFPFAGFGKSVGVSGSTILVGASAMPGYGNSDPGTAYFFTSN